MIQAEAKHHAGYILTVDGLFGCSLLSSKSRSLTLSLGNVSCYSLSYHHPHGNINHNYVSRYLWSTFTLLGARRISVVVIKLPGGSKQQYAFLCRPTTREIRFVCSFDFRTRESVPREQEERKRYSIVMVCCY